MTSKLVPIVVVEHIHGENQNHTSAQHHLSHERLGRSVTKLALCGYSSDAEHKEQMRVL